MPFRIDNVHVLDIGHVRYSDGTKIETCTSIARVLVVEAFPAVLNWRVGLEFSADVRSTVACDAEVVDPNGRRLPAAHLKFVAEPGADKEEFPLPVFTANMKGTYTVHVYVDGSSAPVSSTEILVDVAASIA
jgi:hypothetical protein